MGNRTRAANAPSAAANLADKVLKRKAVHPKSVGEARRLIALQQTPSFHMFKERLLSGWPAEQLCRFLQVDRGEMLDQQPRDLIRSIEEYKKTIPPMDFNPDPQPRNPLRRNIIGEIISEGLNELDELERMYRVQVQRINIPLEAELSTGKLFGSTKEEIRLATNILEASAKLKMDLGISTRHLGVVKAVTGSGEPLDKDVALTLEDPQSRQIVTAAASVLERIIKNSIGSDPADLDKIIDEIVKTEKEIEADLDSDTDISIEPK